MRIWRGTTVSVVLRVNPYGLKCKFFDEGEYITCDWEPSENYQGFFHVLHGGIQATLIDEIASWAIFSYAKTAGVTTEMAVKYRKPVYTNRGGIHLRAKVTKAEKRLDYCPCRTF